MLRELASVPASTSALTIAGSLLWAAAQWRATYPSLSVALGSAPALSRAVKTPRLVDWAAR